MQSRTSISQLDIQDVCFRMQSWMSSPKLDSQSVYYFECRARCWTHSSTFKVCMALNAELNIDPTNRNSTWMFSNAELTVEPIARYSKCVLFWMQSWMLNSLLDRYSKCMFSNAELNVEPIARYSKCVLFWMQSWMLNSQLDIQNVCFRMQSWMSNP